MINSVIITESRKKMKVNELMDKYEETVISAWAEKETKGRDKMNKYFTISEFAKLRNININSLRYYEKIGLLKPAYIDEKTKYRYYSSEQLYILNQIILCITIGIPLKEMADYIDNDGNLQSEKLLNQGKLIAQKKMSEIQNNLNFIEYMLKDIESNKKFKDSEGVYLRNFGQRRIITTKSFSGMMDEKEVVSAIADKYNMAQENELFPILPAGKLVEISALGEIKYRFFLEIVNDEKQHPEIEILPKGEYMCRQINYEYNMDIFKPFGEEMNLDEEGNVIIIDNIRLEKFSYETRPSEIQVLKQKF